MRYTNQSVMARSYALLLRQSILWVEAARHLGERYKDLNLDGKLEKMKELDVVFTVHKNSCLHFVAQNYRQLYKWQKTIWL